MPFDNEDWNYKAYASVTDYLMLMAYDQHWSTGEAGPVAGQDWYESILKKADGRAFAGEDDRLLRQLRLQLAERQENEAETVSFQESLHHGEGVARQARTRSNSILRQRTPIFKYTEDDGK